MFEYSLQVDQIVVNKLMYSEFYCFFELGVVFVEKINCGILRIFVFIWESVFWDCVFCVNFDVVVKVFIFMIWGWYIYYLLIDMIVMDKEWK